MGAKLVKILWNMPKSSVFPPNLSNISAFWARFVEIQVILDSERRFSFLERKLWKLKEIPHESLQIAYKSLRYGHKSLKNR